MFGTVNHYGTVDMFAGRYNDAYRKAELDHVENFETPLIRETFKAMLDDWTNDGFDPFASPAETAKPFGVKHGEQHPGRHPPPRHGRAHGRRARRRADPHRRHATRSTACSPTCSQDEPEVHPEPGFEGEVAAFSLFAYLQPLRRHVEPVGRAASARPASTARPRRSTSSP